MVIPTGSGTAVSFGRNEWSGGGREFRMLLDRCEFTGTSFGLAGAKETHPDRRERVA
jgi:hypothetical protein